MPRTTVAKAVVYHRLAGLQGGLAFSTDHAIFIVIVFVSISVTHEPGLLAPAAEAHCVAALPAARAAGPIVPCPQLQRPLWDLTLSEVRRIRTCDRVNCGRDREQDMPGDGSHLASDMPAPALRAWPRRSPVRSRLRIDLSGPNHASEDSPPDSFPSPGHRHSRRRLVGLVKGGNRAPSPLIIYPPSRGLCTAISRPR